jgi:hypothetical protein
MQVYSKCQVKKMKNFNKLLSSLSLLKWNLELFPKILDFF